MSIKKTVRKVADGTLGKLFPRAYKRANELAYWNARVQTENGLANDHYSFFYTDFFGLTADDYAGKRVLDIGCGPRGSLEWAVGAKERVGLDPLAKDYLKLGADKHAMTYVDSPAEAMPFPDGHFDVVCSFNSLDHVENLDATVSEIKRVVAPGGKFLLIVEVNHPPTACEPIELGWNVCDMFNDIFEVADERRFEIGDHNIYKQLRENNVFDSTDAQDRPGIVVAKFSRKLGRIDSQA